MAINKTNLKELLNGQSLFPEEIEMWMSLGFYIPVASVGMNNLYRSDGTPQDITSKTSRMVREAVIEHWIKTRQQTEKVRVVEVDSFAESIKARSES